MTLQFGYWNSRGYAHPIRQLLYITKLEFENVTWPDREGWLAKKQEVFGEGDQLPNCPYLVDGDFIVTESTAIPFYVANKAERTDLIGKDVKDQTRVRQFQGISVDLMNSIIKILGAEDIKEKAAATAKKGGSTYNIAERISKFLGDKDFLVGYFTFADLVVAHTVQFTRNVCLSLEIEDPYAEFGNLLALCKRVEALPELEGFPYNLPYVPAGMLDWFKVHDLPE